MEYVPTIGLEVHAVLGTRTKMFCTSSNDLLEKHPNTNICPICIGHPGTLPVINKQAMEYVIRVGLALGGKIQEFTRFDRKNYFYPDLPKGYQISQYKYPIVIGGSLSNIRIRRVHLEEDAGRLLHDEKQKVSFVDFNRAGVPLMELVTEPDITSASQALEFAQELQHILRYTGVSDADMEKGQLRLEANISIAPRNSSNLGVKVELKNINSFRALYDGIEYELKRQHELLDKKKKVTQETRGWDDKRKETILQRSKEEAHDYRYFPEPDLPPVKTFEAFDLEAIRLSLPELPSWKRERFVREFGISEKEAHLLVTDKTMAAFFENAVSELSERLLDEKVSVSQNQTVAILVNYLTTDLQGLLRQSMNDFSELLFGPDKFAELIKMIITGELSSRAAKDVLKEMFSTGESPYIIMERMGVQQVSDEGELRLIVEKIIKQNPSTVADYKKGKANALQFFIGQIMRETKGKANPIIIQELLKKLL